MKLRRESAAIGARSSRLHEKFGRADKKTRALFPAPGPRTSMGREDVHGPDSKP
jgi:hypothetical protein